MSQALSTKPEVTTMLTTEHLAILTSAGVRRIKASDIIANVLTGTISGTLAAGDDSRITGALQAANNLNDLANAATARTNLGVALGTDVQTQDAGLESISGLATAADKMIYTTASDTYAVTALTAAARTLLDDTTIAAMRTTLGLAIGTNVQAFDAELTALAGLASAADKLPYFTGSGAAALADFSSYGRSLVATASATTARSLLEINDLGSLTVREITTSDTAGATDNIIVADAALGLVDVALPAASANQNRVYTVKKSDSSNNAVTITPDGSDTIDLVSGAFSNTTENTAVSIASNGVSNWHAVFLYNENFATPTVLGTLASGATAGNITANSEPSGSVSPNTRGAGAVDLQQVRSAATMVASGSRALIAGGEDNTASASYSSALGGLSNNVGGTYSASLGGNLNTITAAATNAAVIGGASSTLSGIASAVVGGAVHTVSGTHSACVAGSTNQATGIQSVCIGGNTSVASGDRSTTLGGIANTASGDDSAIIACFSACTATMLSSCAIASTGSNSTGASAVVIATAACTASGTSAAIIASDTTTVSAARSAAIATDTSSITNIGAVIAGGNNHSITAANAAIIGGEDNTAGGESSIATGRFAVTTRYAEQVHSAGRFTTDGDAQNPRAVFRNQTTDATPTELFLDGSAARFAIPSGNTVSAIINVAGTQDDGTDHSHFVRKVSISNVGGTTALVGAVSTIGTDVETNAATALAITADDANDSITITVTGIAAENWKWCATLDSVEISF